MAAAYSNTVTLSQDLKTLYLIDGSRAVPFNLINKAGVVIGTQNGNLTVTSALPNVVIPPDDEEDVPEEPESPDDPTGPIDAPIERLAARPRFVRLNTYRTQYNFIFFKEKGVISIMGASDIDVSIMGASDIDVSIMGSSDIDVSLSAPVETIQALHNADPEVPEEMSVRPGFQIYSFSIVNRTINIKRAGDLLIIAY